jgi:integrase/recombinase XerD
LAIVLLFTTGIRRGELLKLTEGDYDRREATLHVRATKFYKSRLLPIHEGIVNEIEKYLSVRAKLKLPSSPDTRLIWNATRGGRPYTGTGISYCIKPLLHQCGIRAASGRIPRIHDFRHAFAVNALLRWVSFGSRCRREVAIACDVPGTRVRAFHPSLPALHRAVARSSQ